jgi:hypothetical protein
VALYLRLSANGHYWPAVPTDSGPNGQRQKGQPGDSVHEERKLTASAANSVHYKNGSLKFAGNTQAKASITGMRGIV